MTYISRSADTSQPASNKSADEQIYGLLAIADDHQKAVRLGIEAMALQRTEFAKDRIALAQQAEEIKRLSEKLAAVTLQAIPQVAQSAGQAARSAVDKALAGTAETAVQVAAAAAQPTLDGFKGAVSSASTVQLELRKAVKDFRRDWIQVVAVAIISAILAAAMVAYAAIWLQRLELDQHRQKLDQLEVQRTQLTAEVSRLTAEASALQQRQAEQARRGAAQRAAK